MRVTEGRMYDLARESLETARGEVVRTGDLMTSGVRVQRASDDVAAFAEGARLTARLLESGANQNAIRRTRERLQLTDSALATIGDVLHRAIELAVQAATVSTGDTRTVFAHELRQLRQAAIDAANTQAADGEYLLSSFTGLTTPFNPSTGVYTDGTSTRNIDANRGFTLPGVVPGSRLTSVAGAPNVNVFGVIDAIVTALAANDPAAVSAQLDNLQQAAKQVSLARGEAGGYLLALEEADVAREAMVVNLARAKDAAVNTDLVKAAADLAQARTALVAAQAAAGELVAAASQFGR